MEREEKMKDFIKQLIDLTEPTEEELTDAIYDRISWSGETVYNSSKEV